MIKKKRTLPLLDIQNDYVFKNVFGVDENKNVLISFLNAILQERPHIESVELKNTEIPKFDKNGRTIHLDVLAEINPPKVSKTRKKAKNAFLREYTNIEIQYYTLPDLTDPEDPEVHKIKEIRQAYESLERFSADSEARTMAELREKDLIEMYSALNAYEDKIAQQKQEYRLEMKATKEAHRKEMSVKDAELEAKDAELQAKNVELKTLKEIQKKQTIESAKMLLSASIDKDTVAQVTGLSLEEIESLV